jgi:serine/threonine-protein kinase HipA
MNQLQVWYAGWGEDFQLGTLADNGRQLLFEYSQAALDRKLELSPVKLKLSAASFGDFPSFQHRLPGLFADSLPDGWGLMLMDRLFRQRGIAPAGPLERLAFMGDRAMGALRYKPAGELAGLEVNWSLLGLAQESERVLSGAPVRDLRALILAGGSPQGARPKALVQYDARTDQVSTLPDAPGEPWLVKFQASNEHKEVCAIEMLYSELARASGIDMPDTRYFNLSDTLSAFGIARFDRERGARVPIHSLAGLLGIDYSVLGSIDYNGFLRATRFVTKDEREVVKAYRRAVFNVVMHNRDDHAKNFAWRLGDDSRWRVAPAYDLTFNEGLRAEHSLDVGGKGKAITRGDLNALAIDAGIRVATANQVIDEVAEAAGTLAQRALSWPIRAQTVTRLVRSVESCRKLMGS